MEAVRVETTIQQSGVLTLHDLPLQAGEAVEVIILVKSLERATRVTYPLRGKPVTYVDPTEPVADGDWESAG
jgi:hypothetical protein